MPRKSKGTSTSNISEEERLNQIIDTTGNDPNPAVNALMSEDFLNKSNYDALEIALILQQIARGQNALMSLAEKNAEDIARLKAQQEKIDMETVARFEAQKKEIEEILDRATSVKATGEKKDKLIAEGVKIYQQEVSRARASKSVERLEFQKRLAAEPKETIVSPGVLKLIMKNGRQTSAILPEEVRVKDFIYVFQPGVPTQVPASIASILRSRHESQAQTDKLKDMLEKNMEANKLAEEWNKESGAASMPAMPTE